MTELIRFERILGGFPYSPFLEDFGLLTLVAVCPLMAISGPSEP